MKTAISFALVAFLILSGGAKSDNVPGVFTHSSSGTMKIPNSISLSFLIFMMNF